MIADTSKTKPANPTDKASTEISNNNPNSSTNNKKCKKYFMVDATTKIYFNADIDSGNLEKVEQISPKYKLYPGYDRVTNSTNKTYFHFKVFGLTLCTARFHIARVHILEKLLKNGQEASYKPVVRKGKGKFQPIETGVKIYYNKSDEVELSIEYQFGQEQIWTEFAFSYPYPYEDMISMVKELKTKYIDHSEIYFHEEVLAYTQEGRKLEIIHVTERINCSKEREQNVKELFPDRESMTSMAGFKINKPKIIVSGRVHPGETPASFCVEGLLRFLLDERDYRAYLLRRNFHFIIVPMLNPDGVYQGMFRNDINGDNLNRLYVSCSKQKHPTIWSFREYLKSLQMSSQPVLFYFDFHAHPSKKEFFIYGNAFNQFTHQVEAETFGRLLENNCPYFHNVDSIFTEKQMTSKDKYDVHSKEGCGRVYVHRLFNIIHSYTVECGYFSPGKLQRWEPVQAIQKRAQVLTQQYSYIGSWQNCSSKNYTPESYMLMGKSILTTVLDLFHLNPYSRMNVDLRSIATIRKNVAIKIYNCVERFRMTDANVTRKIKELNRLLEEEYYKLRFGEYGLSISENYGMRHPKKTFSLLSRVYLSKKDMKIKINNIDGEDQLQIQYEEDQDLGELEPTINYPQANLFALQDKEESNDASIQSMILSHSTSFKQYKSQLSLKMPKMRQSEQKMQQKYFSQVSQQCLQIGKMGPTGTNLFTIDEDKKQKQEQEMTQITKIVTSRGNGSLNRRESEKAINFLKIDSRSKQRNGTQEKVSKNESNWSLGKTERTVRPQNDDMAIIKASRIDKFLKKQSDTPPTQQVSELEKYIVSKVEKQIKKIMPDASIISRFPSLYAKNLQGQRKIKK